MWNAPNRVREVTPTPSGDFELTLDDGDTLPMSRNYRDRVLR